MQKHDNQFDANRRKFLTILSSGAVALALPGRFGVHAAAAPQSAAARRFVIPEDRFGRMFPGLPPFAAPSTQLQAALLEMGKAGGLLDAKDALDRGPADLITDLSLSANNPNNAAHTAGTTFMGQFMDHDMTFDLTSRLGQPTPPENSPNTRTPAFDLDSVYGGGPIADPELYADGAQRGQGRGRREPSTKFKIESGGLFEDLPRQRDGVAVIADPRNDENLIIAGLHAAFLLFHNRAVDLVSADAIDDGPGNRGRGRGQGNGRRQPEEIFRRARQLTTWHYQWMILHEFLPLFIGQNRVDEILKGGRKSFTADTPFMPVEFQGAAYRFGHSMVRPSYRANLAGDDKIKPNQPFFGMIFDPAQQGRPDPDDLRGGFRERRRFIGWQTFFNFGDGEVRPNKLIDAKLSTPLFDLPLAAIPSGDAPTSLPQRNLLRHITWQLPSGQSIAEQMKVPTLSTGDLSELKALGNNLDSSTPLWYYILKEAQVIESGARLGPVGGRIVGEVIIGLLQLDRQSFLAVQPDWRPTLPSRGGKVTGDFRMVDFLTFAGVDPASRKQ